MKKRFAEEQIIGVLKEAEAGAKPAELCCKHGIRRSSLCLDRSTDGKAHTNRDWRAGLLIERLLPRMVTGPFVIPVQLDQAVDDRVFLGRPPKTPGPPRHGSRARRH